MIIIFSIVVVAQLGCGWTLENDNKLKVKAYVSRNIQLTDMTVDLVDCDEQWQPVRKNKGFNTDELNIGWFFLKNRKEAILFQHTGIGSIISIIQPLSFCRYP